LGTRVYPEHALIEVGGCALLACGHRKLYMIDRFDSHRAILAKSQTPAADAAVTSQVPNPSGSGPSRT